MNKNSILKIMLLTSLVSITLTNCDKGNDSSIVSNIESSTSTSDSSSSNQTNEFDYREDRDFSKYKTPSNQFKGNDLPNVSSSIGHLVVLNDQTQAMVSGNYRLEFIKTLSGKYAVQVSNIKDMNDTLSLTRIDDIMFKNELPIRLFLKGSSETVLLSYDQVTEKEYGYEAHSRITSKSNSVLDIKDCYYFAKENEQGVFNVHRFIEVTNASSSDTGFATEYSFTSAHEGQLEWFAPNNVFKNYTGQSSTIYKETQLGLPMLMMRNKSNGQTLSLSRYQPIVNYENNAYATLQLDNRNQNITIAYPSNEANRKYYDLKENATLAYDLSIRAEVTESYETASSSVYNSHFNLQNQRIVNTDIDEVYKVINEDYKTFLHKEEQFNEDTGKKYTSYGLPWRITIEDGEFGPYTYQAGFIGQQLPSAYNMMLYGIKNNDLTSLQNGIDVLDFWVEDAEFMSVSGVPNIWYDTWADDFRAYPCFTRMAVDAMEGLLDAYRLATAHGIVKDSWLEAIQLFAEFLVNNQNDDGSYYRCYNYDGGPFKNWDNGIEEPINNICQSESKSSSPMPVRFLGKIYELTGNEMYKNAALRAGEYVYDNFYLQGYYQGGTCDNPNAIDKEAGVYAMYCYDTLYTLTNEEKWLTCLKQAAAFTMSTVIAFSYPVRESKLKAAYPLYAGYSDGLSFISCNMNSGVDNYIAYVYYELFRIYIMTGDVSYLRQAEFVQQNTKSAMNWDGTLNYKYKSLIAEASSISSFNFSSASDGAWVTWSSVANAEPIAKMYTNFGQADVAVYKNTSLSTLKETLQSIGCGGKEHTLYSNNVVSKIN